MIKKLMGKRNFVSLVLVLIIALLLILVINIRTVYAAEYNVAYANTQIIEINGKKIEFQMYALRDDKGDTNYVKLRDIAYVLNNTSSSFDVDYYNGTIYISKHFNYLNITGAEMTTPFSGNREYKAINTTLIVDGEPRTLNAIMLYDNNGGGYTYVKLRDLGNILDFKVDWIAGRGIIIETETKKSMMPNVEDVVRMVNEERAKVGLSPLRTTTSLDKAAQIRAEELTKYYSHTRPDGRLCYTVLYETGAMGGVWTLAENIVAQAPTAEAAMKAWMDSPAHRENILSRHYTKIGVAFAYDSNGVCYWVQDFTN